jgi:cytochrome oxidase assembly protein ShyY1
MKRLPLLPTLIVAAACLTMIGLGIWQLQRAQWKNALLAQYAAAQAKPPITYPAVPYPKDLPLFRRASGFCLSVANWRATSGRNVKGDSGWAHIAQCATGAEGPGISVVAGWSKTPANPVWKGGDVSGVIAPDSQSIIRLVSDAPLAPGLEASAPPSVEDIPNNHFGYAVQWFLFAGVAAVIYLLALRRRKTA